MKTLNRTLVAVVAATLALTFRPTGASAQNISGSLGKLAEDNGKLYVAPVFEGLGYAMNSGFSGSASVHHRFGFDFGVRVMGALIPNDKKTFTAVTPSSVSVDIGGIQRTYSDPYAPEGGSLVTPTAVGPGSGIRLVPQGQFRSDLLAAGEDPTSDKWALPFPDGYDVPAVPFVVIQGSLGLGFHTQVTVRAIPSVTPNSDVGKVKAFGIGAQHEISGWFPTLPVDVSVEGGYQNFSVGDYLNAHTTTFSILAGKGLGPLDLYVLGRTVHPSVDVGYTVNNPNGTPGLPADGTRISFTPDLSSETRFGVGGNLRLLVVNIAGEYTMGTYNVASVKVGFTFH